MTDYRIVPAKPIHAGMMSLRMRAEDRAEIEGLGYRDVRRTLRLLVRSSSLSRAAFVGDEIAALWGISNTLLSGTARGWLVTTATIERIPLAFFRECRRGIDEILARTPLLVSQVAFSYDRAIRFYKLLGFDIGEPLPIGANGEYYCAIRIAGVRSEAEAQWA